MCLNRVAEAVLGSGSEGARFPIAKLDCASSASPAGGIAVQIARHQITLAVDAPPDIYGHGGQAAYGFLLEVCRAFEPALSRAVHDGDGPKPLSVSPLSVADGSVRFSCGTLDTGSTAGIAAALEAAQTGDMALGIAGSAARVESVETLCSSYADLHDRASQARSIDLQFTTPTLFRRSGTSIVLPQPELLFQSLLRTWNAFSPMQFPPHDQAEFATIMISGHRIHTRMSDFGSYKLLGFLGSVKYLLPDEMHPLLRRTINCLADYAFFAGVGYKTTMGMGLCRRV